MKFNVRHGGFTLILLLLGLPAYEEEEEVPA